MIAFIIIIVFVKVIDILYIAGINLLILIIMVIIFIRKDIVDGGGFSYSRLYYDCDLPRLIYFLFKN